MIVICDFVLLDNLRNTAPTLDLFIGKAHNFSSEFERVYCLASELFFICTQ